VKHEIIVIYSKKYCPKYMSILAANKKGKAGTVQIK
jgi:hypothetical protein